MIMPSPRNSSSARFTVIGLTSNRLESSASEGSRSPTAYAPCEIDSRNASYTRL